MATGQYIGVNGVARKVTSPYIGVNGVARNVKSGYVGVNGVARLFFAPESGKVVLEVEKITSNTYANSTTYTAEEFILLDIYPKTGGTVNVTYGGLTKTITDTSGAEKPNAQQVFFGTFNGVSDSVPTPKSGTLTIDGDYYAFCQGNFEYGPKIKLGGTCQCVSCVNDWGVVTEIPAYAFKYIVSGENPGNIPLMTSVTIPDSISQIGEQAFFQQTSLTELVMLATNPPTLGAKAFDSATFPIVVPKGCGNTYKTVEGWSTYADRIVEET